MRLISVLLTICAACSSGDDLGRASQAVTSGVCMADAYGGALNCTANDVGIASASNIRGLDGQPLTSCVAGTVFSFVADFTVDLTAQARYDIGLYFATDGDPDHTGALSGTCDVSVITPASSPNYVQIDAAPDACGDIDADHDPQIVTVQVDNVLCTAGAGGLLSLPNCTSWRQAGSNGVCTGPADAFPGAPSKCNCDVGFTVPIHVDLPDAAIVKEFVGLLCWTGTIRATTTNPSATRPVTLTAFPDSHFGDLFSVHDDVLATTCAPTLIAPGGSYACTFEGRVCGPTETDQITGTFVDDLGQVITRTSNTIVVNVTATAQ